MSPKSRRTASKKSKPASTKNVSGERLQKVLAAAGVASRRECEELILAGRVDVDRETVTVLGTRVDPRTQEVRVDGCALAKPRHVYYVLNKPTGVVSTNRDPEGRLRVIDLVPNDKRLFTIGRLDRSSEGMIIVTNDGELANQLTHPRYGIPKTYRAKVLGTPTAETLQKLRSGVRLAEGTARVTSLAIRGRHARGAELEIVLTEGRNREIRRILAKVDHRVQHLRRTAIGAIRLGQLKPGEYRLLSADEVRLLQRAAGTPARKTATGRQTGVPSTASGQSVRSSQAVERAGKSVGGGRKPVKGKPVKGKSVKGKPVKGKPVKGRPVKGNPVKGKPVKGRPVKGKPVKGKPVKGKPVKGKPVKGKPVKGKPVKGKPVKGKPVKGKPVKGKPVKGKRAGVSKQVAKAKRSTTRGDKSSPTGTVLDYDRP